MPGWIAVIVKSVGLLVGVLLITRLLGKKNLSQVTPFYLIVYVVIGVLAAILSLNLVPQWSNGFIALVVWALLPLAMTFISIRSKWFHDLIEGKARIFIKQGKLMEENMQKERYTPEELLRQLRAKNIFSMADVEFAVLEPTGEINAMLKADKQPIAAKDLGEKVPSQSEPQTVILDGVIMDESLTNLGLNRQWLEIELDKLAMAPENIFLAQVNSFGELYIDLFDDAIQLPKPQVREMVYATLAKVKADLYTFALDTNNKESKEIYYQDAAKIEELMKKLRPLLLH